MSAKKEVFVNLLTRFKKKINRIPDIEKEVNSTVDFSSGRHQEIMIVLESLIEDLDNDFYLFCEEVEKLID